MTSAADRLRRIADLAPGALGDDGVWLAAMINDHFAARGLTATDRRNEALQRLAAELVLPETNLAGRVAAVRAAIRRYQSGRWQRSDRWRETMPPEYAGRPEEHLFAAFHASGGKVPSSPKQLGRVLLSPGNHKRTAGHFAMSQILAHDETNHEG